MDNLKQHTGCQIQPPEATDYPYEIIAGSSNVPLPKEFEIEMPWHLYQNGIDACVGMAVANAKSVQEGKVVSPRVLWGLAKKEEGYLGWGTYINKVLDALVNFGTTDFGFLDEEVVGVDRQDYMRFEVTNKLREASKPNKALSYWWVKGWQWGEYDVEVLKRALFNERIPLITSMYWYDSYNLPASGFLPKPKGDRLGHCFVLRGWRVDESGREYLVFRNSWRKEWGVDGDFYIYVDEIEQYHVSTCYVITDIPQDKASLIAKYQGKIIRNADKPEHYFVGKRYIAHIKNEKSFYFGRDNGFWGDWSDTIIVDQPIEHDIVF